MRGEERRYEKIGRHERGEKNDTRGGLKIRVIFRNVTSLSQ